MRGIQSNTMIFDALRATGALCYFFPEGRTYSPPRRGGGISCGNRALSEGAAAPAGAYGQCHITAVLLSLSTQLSQTHPLLRLCAGVQIVPHFAPTACENLPPAALSQMWVSLHLRYPFSFYKKETKTRAKDGENKWQFTIWKQKWSAGAKADLLLLHPHI